MQKIALVVFSNLEGAGFSAVYRAMMFAQELRTAGDDVCIVFDGSGSTAAAQMLRAEHDLHPIFQSIRPLILGICRYCAKSYDVLAELEAAELPLLIDDRGHASLRALLLEGRQIITI